MKNKRRFFHAKLALQGIAAKPFGPNGKRKRFRLAAFFFFFIILPLSLFFVTLQPITNRKQLHEKTPYLAAANPAGILCCKG